VESYPATLQFDVGEYQTISAVDAGRALIAWATAIHDASVVIDPTSPIIVDLVGTETACLRLHAILRYIEGGMDRFESGLAPYPKIKNFLALNVFTLPGMIIGGAAGAGIVEIAKAYTQNDPPAVQQATKQAARRLEASPVVRNDVQQFYKTVEASRAVTGVKIYETNPASPIVAVPRSHFAELGGLWMPQSPDIIRRPKQAVWDVIVTHPAIISKPRVWRFRRDGLPFKAKLADPYFLNAIKNHTLPMQIAEGTLMRVRVEWLEVLHGDEWMADTGTFVISKVLWPAPLQIPVPAPLLSIIDQEDSSDDKHRY